MVELPLERSVSVQVCSKGLETTVQGSHHSWLHVLKSQSVRQSAYQCSAQSSEDLSGEDLKELEAADDVLEYSSTDDDDAQVPRCAGFNPLKIRQGTPLWTGLG